MLEHLAEHRPVERGVSEGQRLGRGGQHRSAHPGAQQLDGLGGRVDARDDEPASLEQLRERSLAGADVQEARPGPT